MEKTYISHLKHQNLVASIIRDITSAEDEWKPDYVVGITRGGLIAANLISQYFNIPMETLNVSLRDNGGNIGPESNCWMSEDAFGYNDEEPKNILIVDDINDEGNTLQWIKDDWRTSCLPNDPEWNNIWGNNVRVAVVINNEASSFKEISYSAMTINKQEDPCWIVFPWEEWWKGEGAI